jgi:hypothetical protein
VDGLVNVDIHVCLNANQDRIAETVPTTCTD